MSLQSRFSSNVISLGAAAALLTACTRDAPSIGGDDVVVARSAIHNHKACAVDELGWRASFAAVNSQYGNWCGGDLWGNSSEPLGATNGLQPALPVSCWDASCQEHDYSFGRPRDGWYSCHAAAFPALPETTCTQFADDNLCGSWGSCSAQVDEANASWHLVRGRGGVRRVCNDGPPREAQRCRYLEHPLPGSEQVYTCKPCPGPASVSFGEPAPGCAVHSSYVHGLDARRAKEKAYHACCWFIPEAARPPTCCSADHPVWNADTRLCEDCPTDRPRWNATLHEPACEACPTGTTWNATTRQCESSGACPADWELVPVNMLALAGDGSMSGLRGAYTDGTVVMGEGPIRFGPHDSGDVPSWYPASSLAGAGAPALWQSIWGIGGETLSGYIKAPRTGVVDIGVWCDDYCSLDVAGLSVVGDNTGSATGQMDVQAGVWYPITIGYQNRWGSNGIWFGWRCL